MKKRYLLGILVLFCLLLPSVLAIEEIPIAVYVLGIDNYNPATGTYNMDFWIDFKCKQDCPITDFELINGRATNAEEINIPEDNLTYYRVDATLTDKVELHDFPFDSQTIKIVIEHRKKDADKLILVPDLMGSGVDPRVYFPGWRIDGWTAYSTVHFYEPFEQSFSTYVFEVELTRYKDAAVSFFLPIFFIVFIILFTFLLGLNKLELRLGIVSSALIAAIMYQLAISSKLPPAVGYLIFADKVMLLTYFVLLVSFILNIYMLRLVQAKKIKSAQKWLDRTKHSMIIITIALYVLLFILFYYGIM
jgi:hypothetical protein